MMVIIAVWNDSADNGACRFHRRTCNGAGDAYRCADHGARRADSGARQARR